MPDNSRPNSNFEQTGFSIKPPVNEDIERARALWAQANEAMGKLSKEDSEAFIELVAAEQPSISKEIQFLPIQKRINYVKGVITEYKANDVADLIAREQNYSLSSHFGHGYEAAFPINPQTEDYRFLSNLYPNMPESSIDFLNSKLGSNMIGSRYKESYIEKLVSNAENLFNPKKIIHDLIANRYVCAGDREYLEAVEFFANYAKDAKSNDALDFHIDEMDVFSDDPAVLKNLFQIEETTKNPDGSENYIFKTQKIGNRVKPHYVPRSEYEGLISGRPTERGRNAIHLKCSTYRHDKTTGARKKCYSETQIIPSLSTFLIDEFITHDPYKSLGAFSVFDKGFTKDTRDNIIGAARNYAASICNVLGEEEFIKNFRTIKDRVDARMKFAVYIATHRINKNILQTRALETDADFTLYDKGSIRQVMDHASEIGVNDIREEAKRLKIDLEDINAMFTAQDERTVLKSNYFSVLFRGYDDSEKGALLNRIEKDSKISHIRPCTHHI